MATSPCHHCGKLADDAIIVRRMPPPGLSGRLLDQLDWSRLPYLYCSEGCAAEHWANEHRKVPS
jgi:hypothetical protein